MRSDDRTTQEFEDHRGPEHPHGRRKTDWTLRRIIEIGTAIGLLWAGFTGISAAIGARWATHAEVNSVVRPVAVKVDSVANAVDTLFSRFERIEQLQPMSVNMRALIGSMARYQCLDARDNPRKRERAEAADMPCDSLIRRMR